MITAEEYLKEQKAYHSIPEDFYELELIDILEGFGNLMYNQALEDAAKNVTTKSFKLSKYSKRPRWKKVEDEEEVDLFSFDFKTDVDKQSILKLKK